MCGIFLKIKNFIKPNIIFCIVLNGGIPRVYGLPKIHKVPVPLRPTGIVSFINSPTYNLSKFLTLSLSSLLVNHYSVHNFKEFVDYV